MNEATVPSGAPAPAQDVEIRERILVEVLANGDIEHAELQRRMGSCDIGPHVEWLIDATLLERSGAIDNPTLRRGKRLSPGR